MMKHYVFGGLSFFLAFFSGVVFFRVSLLALMENIAPKPGVPEGSFCLAVLSIWLGLYLFRKGLRYEATKREKTKKRAA